MIPSDIAPQGSDLGGAVLIFAALVAVAGLVWLAGSLRSLRQTRQKPTVDPQHIDSLVVLLAMAHAAGNELRITSLTAHLEQHGYTVTADGNTLRIEETA